MNLSTYICIYIYTALHGDTGNVVPGDVAILVSYSGATAEVCLKCSFGFRNLVSRPTRGEKSASFKCWIVKFVLEIDALPQCNGETLSNRPFAPEQGRSRGFLMNTQVL